MNYLSFAIFLLVLSISTVKLQATNPLPQPSMTDITNSIDVRKKELRRNKMKSLIAKTKSKLKKWIPALLAISTFLMLIGFLGVYFGIQNFNLYLTLIGFLIIIVGLILTRKVEVEIKKGERLKAYKTWIVSIKLFGWITLLSVLQIFLFFIILLLAYR